jgi:hypothetical protein
MQGRVSHLIENAGKMSQESEDLRRVEAAELKGGPRWCMRHPSVDVSTELGVQIRIRAGSHSGSGEMCLRLGLTGVGMDVGLRGLAL